MKKWWLVLGGAGVLAYLFKDKLFGSPTSKPLQPLLPIPGTNTAYNPNTGQVVVIGQSSNLPITLNPDRITGGYL